MLDDLVLKSRQNIFETETGIDSLVNCLDKRHFRNFPYNITYQYNSRGFRDDEWPVDLKNSFWCIGDSFTVGLGCPVEYTWPKILQSITKVNCINVSMDGASNSWIARRAAQVLTEIQPKTMIIHWSYLHRCESEDSNKTDEDRRMPYFPKEMLSGKTLSDVELLLFESSIRLVESNKGDTKIIHSFIPNAHSMYINRIWQDVAGPNWPVSPKTSADLKNLPVFVVEELTAFGVHGLVVNCTRLNDLLVNSQTLEECKVIDFARDYYHYGPNTATKFANQVAQKLS